MVKIMIKYSIIVPIYNTSNTLNKCLSSILNQSYDNFEIIAVNDGSTDNSFELLKSIKDSRIKIVNQKNMGLSEARNNGVKKSKGDYLLFVDSDDYISKNLLKKLNDTIENEDIIRFQMKTINKESSIMYSEDSFKALNGKDAFKIIANYHFVEPVCCYAIKRDYYISNNFSFTKNTYHEDFGLMPLIIIKANSVTSINYIGYNYVSQEGSITKFTTYEKEVKKSKDVLLHYKNLINKSDDIYYKSFLSNTVLLKAKLLKGKDFDNYIKEIKSNKVLDNLLSNTLKRKIKKILLNINLKIFIKVI